MGLKISSSRVLGALVMGTLSAGVAAQGRTLSADDYARAERFMSYNTAPLVDHTVQKVDWLDDGHFWYVDHDAGGDHFVRMDAASGKTAPLFDQAKLAAALGEAGGKPVDAKKLPVTGYEARPDGRIDVAVRGKHYVCDLAAAEASCVDRASLVKTGKEPGALSPDKKSEAFIRDWNLWLRDVASGQETQLTTDGVENFGYATDNAGWKHTDNAIVEWSPDSKRIATFQQDQRKTGEMYLVSTNVGHPKLEKWKYPLVGDKDVTMIERVIIDVAAKKVTRLQMPPDQHRSSLCDDVSCGPDGGWDDVKWAADGKTLAFVSTSRDHKHEWFRIADATTGKVHTVFEEVVPTYYESGNGAVNWRYLPETNEAIWFSERNNWGNLYLYDLTSGKLKRAITKGEGNVTEVLKVDPKTRTVWFRGVGRTAGVNPYYQQFFKVSLDGGKPVLLTPEAADHTVTLSPDGKSFVDAYSTPTTPPVTVLRSSDDGRDLANVATADISRLKAAGWVPPIPFTVKGRDGKTDLYGMMFKPTNFDPSKKYPIIDYIYPGPQTGSVRGRSFSSARADHQAMAELGFIVIALDGMGTPWRSKAFHDAYFEHVEDNTLPDQVLGLKELGKKYPWIDLDRVGIWGHSGGGNATAAAMFHYPDFFKVGWAESGNHDNRNYEDDWAEKWQGLLVTDKDGKTNYDAQANQSFAKNLKGRLMLVHGTMDDNVPPYQTLLVADALIKANKDFDLLLIPNVHHGYAEATPYATRRRWDYFVQYLAGNTPPHEYQLKAWPWR
ncbi:MULTISPECIES: DPP IV N-terminal domain-containing protein [unclassified Rhodanobacter]|uniref:S9 family peptidase n=1 Tax=unclassified Rhodanobacter TaxID=2621553 RepID=UPI001BDE294E|nr:MULTISPECIES: DPP IV N-terminal domain-containing protein [unclassified Rhodanobacter]MBT2143852.1 DPP IV N-terminal domain-containing protein [Rhodanobacter sp. LX-99]MBT2147074.1 DPP IV N-terminal domain-containing protein [Rhodanobacter sp. LX-100]